MKPEIAALGLSKPGVFMRCLAESFGALRQPVVLIFVLPLFLAELAWLIGLTVYPQPPTDRILTPLFREAGGNAALHYPEARAALLTVFFWGSHVLRYVFGSIAAACLVLALPEAFRDRRPPILGVLSMVRKRLVAIWLVVLPRAIALGGARYVLDEMSRGNDPWTLGVRSGIIGVAFVVEGFLAYSLAAALHEDRSAASAWLRSADLASRSVGLTAGFVLLPRLLLLPVTHLQGDIREWFSTLTPEFSFAVAFLAVVAHAIALYLLVAMTTRFFFHWYGGRILGFD